MTPIKFPEQTNTYEKPQGVEKCGPLPARQGKIDIGNGQIAWGITSCWQPSEEEIKDIVAGKPIYLTIYGYDQPMVNLSTELIPLHE